MVFSEDKSKCVWYKGKGKLQLIDVERMQVVKQVTEFSGNFSLLDNTILRKLVGLNDAREVVSLEINENDDKKRVMLHHFDILNETTICKVDYFLFTSKSE